MNVAIMKVWCKAFLNGKVTQTKDKSFQFCFHFKSFKCKRDLLCIRFTKLLSSAKCFRWKCLWHSKNLQNELQKHCFFNFLIQIFFLRSSKCSFASWSSSSFVGDQDSSWNCWWKCNSHGCITNTFTSSGSSSFCSQWSMPFSIPSSTSSWATTSETPFWQDVPIVRQPVAGDHKLTEVSVIWVST